MAGKSAILTVKILTDASQAGKGTEEASSKFQKFQSGLNKASAVAAVAGAAMIGFGKQAVDSASRSEQAMGALDSVFGKQSDTVKTWASDAASAVGLSTSAYGELASQVGAQLQNMGLSTEDAASSTNDLIKMGADLAATFGGTTEEAVSALGAALRGEADPAERYGLALNQTAVNAALAEKGMDDLTGQAATTAKAQTLLEMATKQSGGALGQFARESDSASGSAQIAAAQWENAKAALGEALLPAVTAVTEKLGEMATWLNENKTLVLTVGGVIAGLVVTILGLNAAITAYSVIATTVTAVTKVWTAVTKGMKAAMLLLNAAMRANPIGAVITVVTLLVAGIVLLWNKNEGFRNFVTAAWKAIANVAKAAWNLIKTAALAVLNWVTARVKSMQATVSGIWRAIATVAKTAWNGIRSAVSTVASWIGSRIQALRATVNAVWTAIRTAATAAFNGVKSVVSSVTNAIKTIIRSIQTVASGVWSAIKTGFTAAMNAILAPVRAVKSAFDSVVNAVQSLIGWISRIKMPSMPSWLSKVLPGGQSAPAPSTVAVARGAGLGVSASPRARAGVSASSSAWGGLVQINVSGTLNDAQSARAVRRVLRNDARRRGGVVIDRSSRAGRVSYA